LSPRTYRRTTNVARKARFELGVCKQCKQQWHVQKSKVWLLQNPDTQRC
jgi:hypothetical protein